MRTTLDINPRVLAAARSSVAAGRHKSLGEAISDFSLAGLASRPKHRDATAHGLVLLPSVAGQVVTDQMVADALHND